MCLHNALFILYSITCVFLQFFIWCDIFDLNAIKSWIHTCSFCASVCKLIVKLTVMEGAPAKILPRAPNCSGPELM